MTAQEEFNSKYVCASEICTKLDVSRTALTYAIEREEIPRPILVGKANLMLWERSVIEAPLEAWTQQVATRKARVIK